MLDEEWAARGEPALLSAEAAARQLQVRPPPAQQAWNRLLCPAARFLLCRAHSCWGLKNNCRLPWTSLSAGTCPGNNSRYHLHTLTFWCGSVAFGQCTLSACHLRAPASQAAACGYQLAVQEQQDFEMLRQKYGFTPEKVGFMERKRGSALTAKKGRCHCVNSHSFKPLFRAVSRPKCIKH